MFFFFFEITKLIF